MKQSGLTGNKVAFFQANTPMWWDGRFTRARGGPAISYALPIAATPVHARARGAGFHQIREVPSIPVHARARGAGQ